MPGQQEACPRGQLKLDGEWRQDIPFYAGGGPLPEPSIIVDRRALCKCRQDRIFLASVDDPDMITLLARAGQYECRRPLAKTFSANRVRYGVQSITLIDQGRFVILRNAGGKSVCVTANNAAPQPGLGFVVY